MAKPKEDNFLRGMKAVEKSGRTWSYRRPRENAAFKMGYVAGFADAMQGKLPGDVKPKRKQARRVGEK